MNRKTPYRIVVAVAAVWIVWTILNRFVFDPAFAEFLSRKTGLDRPIRLPLWLTMVDIHIGFACVALLAGAMNFSGRLLRNYRTLHRVTGYVYIVSVAAVIITSGYLAPYATGGKIVSISFNLLNIVWMAITIAALVQIKRKQIQKHRRWMVRSYAFCFTNQAIHMLLLVFVDLLGMSYANGYAASVIAAIVALFLAAELAIRLFFRNPPQGIGVGRTA